MVHGKNNPLCTGCMLCKTLCPTHSISMETSGDGFIYPKVDLSKCVGCDLCNKKCPVEHKPIERKSHVAYSAIFDEKSVRKNSSSGGVFFAIANAFINSGGVVYGAAYSMDYREVYHLRADSRKTLDSLCGSKYVQSNIDSVYDKIRNDLSNGQKILFVGTPCQIAAIVEFSNYHPLLFTVDLICHGTPSPKAWNVYLNDVHRNKKIKSVFMRDKTYGWRNFSMCIVYQNGKVYKRSLAHDLYLRGFLENVFLRKSCYQCAFKSTDRLGDITLADYWGMLGKDDGGTSLVAVNTEKGELLFGMADSRMITNQVNWKEAIAHNTAATQSVEMKAERKLFFSAVCKGESFSKAVRKCLKKRSLKDRFRL